MRRALLIVLPAAVGLCTAIWGIAVQVNAQVVNEVNWWPYPWLYLLAGVAITLAVGWLVTIFVSERTPKTEGSPVQLYTFTWLTPEGNWTHDKRLFERREYKGIDGSPEWDIKPGDGTMRGQFVAYRSYDEPHQVVSIQSNAHGAARNFLPVLTVERRRLSHKARQGRTFR